MSEFVGQPQDPGWAAAGAMLMTPTVLSVEPPVAQASSAVRFQVRVTITMILCWASSPVSVVKRMLLM